MWHDHYVENHCNHFRHSNDWCHDHINATICRKDDIITAQDTDWRNQDSKSYQHRPRKNNCDASGPHFQSRRRSNNSGLRPDLQTGR